MDEEIARQKLSENFRITDSNMIYTNAGYFPDSEELEAIDYLFANHDYGFVVVLERN